MRKKSQGGKSLVSRMDAEANDLLGQTKDASLETRIAIFAQVAKWVQVRNRIAEGEETEGLLDAYRTRIDGAQSALAEREASRIKDIDAPNRRWLGKHQRATRGSTTDNGGAALEALKSRLPGTDGGNADDDRRSRRGEGVAISGSNRIVRSDLPGAAGTDVFDETHTDIDF